MNRQPDQTWTVAAILAATAGFLGQKGADSPRLDAELLLNQVLGLNRIELYLNFERPLSGEELAKYRELVRRRARHEPVAYILGRKEFYGLNLTVGPTVLIPRPETEHLVDEALKFLQARPGEVSAADIGCGSGAIALALAHNLPQSRIAAVDLSQEALDQAQANAEQLALTPQIDFFQGDLLKPLSGRRFHLICANLPYIPTGHLAGLMPDVKLFEPRLALDGGPEGLTPITRLLDQAPDHLEPEGGILLEIWPDSLARLLELAQAGGFSAPETIRDFSGKSRLVLLRQQFSNERTLV